MMMHGLRCLSVILFCWTLATPSVQAFVREKTDLGVPIFWPSLPIPYGIGKGGSQDVTDGSDIEAVKRGFARWSAAACSRIQFRFFGLVDLPQANAVPNADGSPRNLAFWVKFQADWPFAQDVLAVTTLKYVQKSGVLEDADIRFNDFNFKWSTSPSPPKDHHDIENTATHEVGHLLGLTHTDDAETTMFGESPPGEIKKRDLAKDDRNGACAIYPKDPKDQFSFTVVRTDLGLFPCAPPNPDFRPKPSDAGEGSGCQIAIVPAAMKPSVWWWSFGFLCLFCGLRLRRPWR